jgi:hypothetical protein
MVETAEAKQVNRAASSMLFPELDFGIADNGTYRSEDFQRVLARIAFDNEFANAGAKAYQLARGDDVDVGAESRNTRGARSKVLNENSSPKTKPTASTPTTSRPTVASKRFEN